ncbi:MAG: autotransporter domain-containing protein [Gallionella sp.]|nr:autotransporter domain-containing protein [Gallionella sp.]
MCPTTSPVYPFLFLKQLAAVVLSALAVQAQAADIFTGLGGTSARANGISADGSTAVGSNTPGVSTVAYRWSNGVLTSLGTLVGGTTSMATATSGNGNIVVGRADIPGKTQAFRWSGGVMTGLGFLPGDSYSTAQGVSGNGSVVVGYSGIPIGLMQAFRWTGGVMTGLGVLPGYARSFAYAVSADGSVVVGLSNSPIATQAFRWTQATGMTGLGFIPGGLYSSAYGISADGTTVVGDGGNGVSTEAFRWKGGIMTGLGFLPGDAASRANAASFDGSVIVGSSSVTLGGSSQAFRWTQAGGIAPVVGWLASAGVFVPAGWNLSNATGVSENGNVVVGNGIDPGGFTQPWLARVGRASGLLTDIPAYNRSLSRGFADLPNLTLFGAHHRSLLDNGLTRSNANDTCVWAVADAARHKTDDTNIQLAEVGVCQDIGNTRLGVGVGLQAVQQTLAVGGTARYNGQSLIAEGAHAFANGFQPSVTGYFGRFSTELSRTYKNGANLDTSNASPKADTFAVRLRLDWKDAAKYHDMSISPYIAYTRESIKLDAYSETGGGFPAQFSASNWRISNLRIGNAAKFTLSDTTDLRIGLEAVRHINKTVNAVTGNVIGLWNFTLPAQSVKQNSIRTMIDVDHRISPSTALTFGVNASTGSDSTWGATAGLWSSL